MAEIVKQLDVNVDKQNTYKEIVAKQGDAGSRKLKVKFLNEGKPMTLDTAALASINIERPDGEKAAYAGTIGDDNTVTVQLPTWMLQVEGQAKCSISIVYGETRLTSTTFYVNVEPAEYSASDIEDDEEIDLLVGLLTAAQNESERIEAENGRIQAENVRVTAESNRALAESSRNTAETNRNNAETSRNNAETAREQAAAAATEAANAAARSAEDAAQEVSSALLAGGIIPLYDEDDDKNYTYQIKIKDGYPVLVATEAVATE